MKRLKMYLATLLAGMPLLAAVVVPSVAVAQNIEAGACEGSKLNFSASTPTTNTCAQGQDDGNEAVSRVNSIMTTAVNIFSVIVGVAAVIMIMVGGFKYITSGGDSSSISGAKNTILYAVIGLVVVALAQFIVRFVLARATS